MPPLNIDCNCNQIPIDSGLLSGLLSRVCNIGYAVQFGFDFWVDLLGWNKECEFLKILLLHEIR
jgi:hypothetical protein